MRRVVFFTDLNTRQDPRFGKKGPGHQTLTVEWIRKRLAIWERTAWASIKNQNHGDWKYIIRCAPGTYGPVRKWVYEIVGRDLRVGVCPVLYSDEKRAIEALAGDADICMVRLDSDDMYHCDVAGEVAAETTNYLWYYWRNGYAFDFQNKIGYHYCTRKCGPFFVHRYTPEAWKSKRGLAELDHSTIWRKKAPKVLAAGRFIVGVTGHNSTTNPRMRNFLGRMTEKQRRAAFRGFPI